MQTLALSDPCPFFQQAENLDQMGVPFWLSEEGQDVAEYAVMLAIVLVLIVMTIRLIGSNANNVFSSVGSNLQ